MSRCYLDANFLYVHLRDPDHGSDTVANRWRERVMEEVADDSAVISSLVLDEIAYRLILAWLRDDGSRDPLTAFRRDDGAIMRSMAPRLYAIWDAIDDLGMELEPTGARTIGQAKALMAVPGLAPRDAFHAAHAICAGCSVIASSDVAFDRVSEIRRVGPPTLN